MNTIITNIVSKIILAIAGGVAAKYGLSSELSALAVDAGALVAGIAAWYWSHNSITNALAFVPGNAANVQKGSSQLRGSPLLLLLMLALPALLLAGCSGMQTTAATSGSGFKGNLSVPIPGGAGSIVGMQLVVGTWKNVDVIQPATTNKLYTPALSIAQKTIGAQNMSAATGSSVTNVQTGIVAGEFDSFALASGDASNALTDVASNTITQSNPAAGK